MSENSAETPEQVVKFEPKGRPRTYDTPLDEAGQAIVEKIQRAAELANENCDRAVRLAHKLSMELRSAGDRINQLESEIQLFQDRAARAEGWLQTIYKQIEDLRFCSLVSFGVNFCRSSRSTSQPSDASATR